MRGIRENSRKWLAAGLTMIFLTALLLTGCQILDRKKTSGEGDTGDRLKVVTTLFPYYDFLRQIAGDEIELTMVVPAGMDSHSFEPTPADIITIQNADILVCNGGEMEQWLSQVLDSFDQSQSGPGRVITMIDYVDIVEEEIVEGMESEELTPNPDRSQPADSTGSADLSDDGHEVEIEYDEHIWTSPANAIKLTKILTDALSEEDPDHAAVYRENSAEYQKQLTALDDEIRAVVRNSLRKLIIFGDKFPLRYFFDEYGLEYRAAFSGCSTDTEPSAQTIAYLIDKVRTEELPVICYLELSSHRVAEIIGKETGAKPMLFHTCHNVTRRDFDSGITYLELMEQNLDTLRKGLY